MMGLPATIRTPDQRLRVFISSTLNELALERRAAREAIDALHLSPIFFEASARPYPAQVLYRAYVAQSDVFVGIYWQSYGVLVPGMDISGLEDEYRLSNGKPRLIYVKEPAGARESQLRRLLDHIRTENVVTYKKFSTLEELRYQLAEDLAQVLTDQFARLHEEAIPSQAAPTLPRPRTPMIDRAAEMASASALLQRDDVTVVTLTGTGGVGKTRLAIEIANQLAPRLDSRVAFVSLAPVREPGLVTAAIAHALHVDSEEGRPLNETLTLTLHARHLLLVVDNAEQVISAVAALVAEILEHAPHLKVLVTSRERLQIRGEHVVHVPPFELPTAAQLRDPAALGSVPSVALFAQRAVEANPHFALTVENADDVAWICERLDGLPLAIELAAAHLDVLAPKLLAQRLERRLPTLTRGPRDLPDRQRTLRNMLAWSYDLLEPCERHLLRSLAVFTGGFGLDAATAIEIASPPEPREPGHGETLDRLESLVAKSLLRVEPGFDGAPRFSMLCTTLEFVQQQLDDAGERARAQRAHLEYFVNLALTAEPHLIAHDREYWLERLEAEDVNLRVALQWCDSHPDAFEPGLRLASALTFYWMQSGYVREGQTSLENMLARTTITDRSHARGKALHGAALLSWKQAETARGARHAEQALSIFRELDDVVWSAQAEWVLAVCRLGQGEIAESRALLEDCLTMFRRAKHEWGEALALAFLGINSELRGQYEEALAYYRNSASLLERIHDVIYTTVAHGILAAALASHGDHAALSAFHDELRRIPDHTANRWAVGRSLQSVAFNLQYNYGLNAAAKALYQGSLLLWRDTQRLEGGCSVVAALAGVAEIAALQRDAQQAGWLLGAADRAAAPSGAYRTVFDQRVARVRGTLTPAMLAVFDAAWRDGYTATVAQASEVALQAAPPATGLSDAERSVGRASPAP
jgi:predicted ATPase